jgi:four helix bundle protein
MIQSTITKHKFDLEDRTLKFSKKVIQLCEKLPQKIVNKELISQLVRASSSIGANYREANDTLTKKDFLHRIGITRREAKESCYWLQLLEEPNPEFKKEILELSQEAFEFKKIFSSIIEKSK